MSQDQDPIDATRRFEPVDPYNIPPEHAGAPAPGYEGYQPGFEQPYGALQPEPRPGFKQRLTRLGPLKLAVLGTAGVIVLGGAAWGTTAALQSGSSSSNTAAAAPATDQGSSAAPGAGATTGGTGKHAMLGRPARVKISQIGTGTFTGTDGRGRTVTVVYDANTRFGTKAHPLTSDELQSGMTVVIIGARQGDTITAAEVAVAGKTPKPSATPGQTATPTDPASPQDGNA